MSRPACLALLLVFVAPRAARAVTLDDFLSRGYSIVASTVLPGSFTGCVRQHRLVFADGSVFACARTTAQTAYEPRVTILRLGGDPPSVVLVGSRVQSGELLRLRLHSYSVPLRMNAAPLTEAAAAPTTATRPLGAIPSINAVTQQRNAPLSLQQDHLPSRSSNIRSSR